MNGTAFGLSDCGHSRTVIIGKAPIPASAGGGADEVAIGPKAVRLGHVQRWIDPCAAIHPHKDPDGTSDILATGVFVKAVSLPATASSQFDTIALCLVS